MRKVKILKESLPARCEICHKSDMFNIDKQECSRCKDIKQKSLPWQQKWQTTSEPLIARNRPTSLAIQPKIETIKPSMECYEHPGETVVGYCKDCQRAICRDCVIEKKGFRGLYCKKCFKVLEELQERETLVAAVIFMVVILILFVLFFMNRL